MQTRPYNNFNERNFQTSGQLSTIRSEHSNYAALSTPAALQLYRPDSPNPQLLPKHLDYIFTRHPSNVSR